MWFPDHISFSMIRGLTLARLLNAFHSDTGFVVMLFCGMPWNDMKAKTTPDYAVQESM